jgi:hypothetical protein
MTKKTAKKAHDQRLQSETASPTTKESPAMSTKKPQIKAPTSAGLVPSFMSPERIQEVNEEVERRRQTVTELIQDVLSGIKVAACFFGPGGHGKSWAVKQELDTLTGKSWVHHTGTCTPRAFFDSLYDARDSLHVYEDMEPILKIPQYADILRPLLDDANKDRVGHWDIKGDEASFVFKGGIIIVCNEDLSKSKSPIGEAMKSRVRPIEWKLSVEELMCVMKKMARAGYAKRGNTLTPREADEVADYLIAKMSSGVALHGIDLRFFADHCLPAKVSANARALASKLKPGTPEYQAVIDGWKARIDDMLAGQIVEAETRDTRADRLEKMALQVSLMALTKPEKAAKWEEMTGLKVAQYYNCLRSAKAQERKNGKGA